MATPLRVPREYEGGLAKIRDLSDESARELLAALQQVPNTYSQTVLSSAVAERVDTIAASDVQEMMSVLTSLYAYRDLYQSAISDVAEGIARTMEESNSERLRLPPEEREVFTSRLAKLLSVEPLNRAIRAGLLVGESEHSWRDARILTDVRPVFDPENPDALRGAVILHTLKISYRADNTDKEFFVALDADDVRQLLEKLERANAKAESLKSLLPAHVPHIDAK